MKNVTLLCNKILRNINSNNSDLLMLRHSFSQVLKLEEDQLSSDHDTSATPTIQEDTSQGKTIHLNRHLKFDIGFEH
jgi:hypothetical protein